MGRRRAPRDFLKGVRGPGANKKRGENKNNHGRRGAGKKKNPLFFFGQRQHFPRLHPGKKVKKGGVGGGGFGGF